MQVAQVRNKTKNPTLQLQGPTPPGPVEAAPERPVHAPRAQELKRQASAMQQRTAVVRGPLSVYSPQPVQRNAPIFYRGATEAGKSMQFRSAGNELVQRTSSVSKPAGSGVVQRILTKALSPKADKLGAKLERLGYPDHAKMVEEDVLFKAYDAAIAYGLSQPEGRGIIRLLTAWQRVITVNLGAPASLADQDELKIDWNPYENIVVTTAPSSTLPTAGGQVKRDDIVGIHTSALELLHEMGHIKQSLEVRMAGIGNLSVDSGVVQDDGHARKSISDLIRTINDLAKSLPDQSNVRPDESDVREHDNLSRHEVPVAREHGEVIRANYSHGVLEEHVTPEEGDIARQAIGKIQKLKMPERATSGARPDYHPVAFEMRTATAYFRVILAELQAHARTLPAEPKWKLAAALGKVVMANRIIEELEDAQRLVQNLIDEHLRAQPVAMTGAQGQGAKTQERKAE
jgi:hypothetical protein